MLHHNLSNFGFDLFSIACIKVRSLIIKLLLSSITADFHLQPFKILMCHFKRILQKNFRLPKYIYSLATYNFMPLTAKQAFYHNQNHILWIYFKLVWYYTLNEVFNQLSWLRNLFMQRYCSISSSINALCFKSESLKPFA